MNDVNALRVFLSNNSDVFDFEIQVVGINNGWSKMFVHIRPRLYVLCVTFYNGFVYNIKEQKYVTLHARNMKEYRDLIALARSLKQEVDDHPYPPQIENEEETMKTDSMINCLYENLNAIQVVFYGSTKHYTYKTFDVYKVGDYCVVDSPNNGYTVVQVVGTDSSKLDSNFRYKWVVQKVDDSDYINQTKKEQEAIEKLSRMMLQARRKESLEKISEMLGGNSIEQITNDLNNKIT